MRPARPETALAPLLQFPLKWDPRKGVPYEDILQAAGYGTFIVARNGAIAMTDAAMESIWGWTMEELRDDPDGHEVFHHSRPDGSIFRQRDCPILRTFLSGTNAFVDNDTFITKDGRYVSVEYSATPILVEERVEAVVVMARRRQVKLLVDLMPEVFKRRTVLWRTSPTGLCTWISEAWREITGCATEAAMGDGWANGIYVEDREKARAAWTIASQVRAPYHVLYRLQGPDGHPAGWFEGHGRPYYDQGGTYLGYAGHSVEVDVAETDVTIPA